MQPRTLCVGTPVHEIIDGELTVTILNHRGDPVQAQVTRAILGRATTTAQDIVPEFTWNGSAMVAPVNMHEGYWNLRLELIAHRRHPISSPFSDHRKMSDAAICPACVGLPEGQLEKAASNGTAQIILSSACYTLRRLHQWG